MRAQGRNLLALWVAPLAAVDAWGVLTRVVHLLAGQGASLPFPLPAMAAVAALAWWAAGAPAVAGSRWGPRVRGATVLVLVILPGLLLLARTLSPSGAALAGWITLVALAEALASLQLWRAVRKRVVREDPLAVQLGVRARGIPYPVVLAGEDRFLHVHVLGPTGSGKTEGVLWPLILQDLDKPEVGVTVLDPKGDLVDKVWDAAASRGRETVLLDPERGDARWNPLSQGQRDAGEAVVYALLRTFPGEHPFYRAVGISLVRHSTRAVTEAVADADLTHLVRFLTDEDWRKHVLLSVRDPEVRRYFRDQFGSWGSRERVSYTSGVVAHLEALLGHAAVRRVLTGPSTFSPAEVLAQGKVLLCRLSPDRLGAAADTLGTFLLFGLQLAALSRPPGGPAHFLYLDEFQRYAGPGFADFLAVARSYRVGAVLAHQNLAQLDPGLREAALSNARGRVLLGGLSMEDLQVLVPSLGTVPRWEEVRGEDGRVVSRRLVPRPRFEPTFLRELPRGMAVIQRTQGGQVQPPELVRLPRPDGRRQAAMGRGKAVQPW